MLKRRPYRRHLPLYSFRPVSAPSPHFGTPCCGAPCCGERELRGPSKASIDISAALPGVGRQLRLFAMSGVIFALVQNEQSALPTLSAAEQLAGLMGSARINVMAVRVPPATTIMPSEEILTTYQAAEIRLQEQARVAALQVIYDGWAAAARSPTLTTEWADVEGLVDMLVGEWGRRSDYLVINRPTARDKLGDRLAMHAALFDTGRPVLAVPPGFGAVLGERIAIAWRDEPCTARSVIAALRLLPSTRPVHVLAGVAATAPSPILPEMLAEHGIEAVLHALPLGHGSFGEALLRKAHHIGADLLVMGAYTRSPWRELILGGVTHYMLANADIPVLMRH